MTQGDGRACLGGPVRIARPREAEDFALARRRARDELLQLGLLAHLAPLVVALEAVTRAAPDEVVAEAHAERGVDRAGPVPGAHAEDEQVARLREDGFFQLVEFPVLLARAVGRPQDRKSVV